MDVCNPVSEFIAREHEALGGLECEFDFDKPSIGPTGIDQHDSAGFVLLNGDERPSPSVSPQLLPTAPATTKELNNEFSSESHTETNGFSFTNRSTSATESWREDFNKRLTLKDAAEENAKKELEENAKAELDEWYAQYRKEREAHSKVVRNFQENADTLTPNTEKSKPTVNDSAAWTAVCNMCDFQAKQKDTGRMRDVLVSLTSPTHSATDVL